MSLSCFPLSKSSALISFAVKQIKIKRANLRPFLVDRPVRLAVVFQISSLVSLRKCTFHSLFHSFVIVCFIPVNRACTIILLFFISQISFSSRKMYVVMIFKNAKQLKERSVSLR